eukprot:TRINITY_DN12200_c0_g1_i3.p2 TRINITY_DN12200_c0_g1~~TRINITY_DN12200_c0_g1_i3.p2  ORF type:complete len:196 (+),score=-23.72 TRINITY_DN12200_c0_g1_i3:183-770(+)
MRVNIVTHLSLIIYYIPPIMYIYYTHIYIFFLQYSISLKYFKNCYSFQNFYVFYNQIFKFSNLLRSDKEQKSVAIKKIREKQYPAPLKDYSTFLYIYILKATKISQCFFNSYSTQQQRIQHKNKNKQTLFQTYFVHQLIYIFHNNKVSVIKHTDIYIILLQAYLFYYQPKPAHPIQEQSPLEKKRKKILIYKKVF